MNSSLVQRSSAVKRNGLNSLLVSEPITQIRLSLWTKALLIAERHTVDELGPYVAGKLLARRFSVEGDGESCIIDNYHSTQAVLVAFLSFLHYP